MKSSNLEEFQNFVLDNTEEKGVHFVMGDGVSLVLLCKAGALYQVLFTPLKVHLHFSKCLSHIANYENLENLVHFVMGDGVSLVLLCKAGALYQVLFTPLKVHLHFSKCLSHIANYENLR